ncbi:MAG TPA: hypothetical protein VLU54_09740 [Casimicrobiaceae bacterium]|nr:hypothetical protein [Casimicrobiaceae bacterium]
MSLAPTPAVATDFGAQYAGSAPIYLFRDGTGNAYALQLPGPGDSTLGKHYVTSGEFSALGALGATIAYLPEHPDAAIGPCTSADFPRAFNIALIDGIVFGNVAKCDPGGRPSWASSQTVEFVLFTFGYRAQAAHTVVIPWFKNALHGHGIYFGDTSAVPCADGRDSKFNTRIEGWSQWSGFGLPTNPYWTSTGPLETATCGTPMTDGWSPSSGIVTTAYKVRVRATADQWVRYEVRRWDGSAWVVHTAPFVRDMRYTDWPDGPGSFDPAANGLMIGSTGPLGPASGSRWMIGIRELSTAWAGGWESAAKSSAVEFYNAALDHYFMTADSSEIGDLDHGVHAGWTRTGYTFAVGTQDHPYADPVCRFYGLPSAGLDSHFYSANSGECEEVKARFGNAWALESADVFAVALPDTVTGECPPHTEPVYRLWNTRKDSNHRYVTDLSVRESMLQRGFVAEGYGVHGVAMCSPLQ